MQKSDDIFNPLELAAVKAGLKDSELLAVRRWLAEQLAAFEYAKLGQGGHANNQIPLRRVFVDLPVSHNPRPDHDTNERKPFLAQLLKAPPIALHDVCYLDPIPLGEQGDISTENSVQKMRLRKERKLLKGVAATLLIGGPGQGKSTLGQLACQLHRAALLKPFEGRLTSSVRDLVRSFEPISTDDGQDVRGIRLPKKPFLPLQVSLPDLATWTASHTSNAVITPYPTILRFITELPSAKRSGLTAEILARLATAMPTLLVLDGFDEVGAAQDRERLVSAANELLEFLAEKNGLAQVIATTRPQGYSGEFSKLIVGLRHCYLIPLKKAEALEYARKLVYEKIPGIDEREQTLKRLEEASSEPSTERLMTTPLQVTILAALVHQRGRAPRERWNLFFGYFSYTYARETERHTYASQLLRDYKAHIEQIHARVALLLQVESERAGGGAARMPRNRLKEVIECVLVEAGFEGEELHQLITDIAVAAEQRLVFLVEPEPGSFGFEIRSFQEFMSAWAITSGREAQVEARLLEIARAPMFRNVTLFVASRLFSEGSHLRDVFGTKVCGVLDSESNDPSAALSKAGPLLALETLEEGAVLSFPRWAKELLLYSAGLLTLPPSTEHLRLARAANEDIRRVLAETIEQKFVDPSSSDINILSAWIVIIEAANRHENWAIDIGNRYWPSETANTVYEILTACKSVSMSMGPWLRSKLLKYSDICRPENFIGVKESGQSHKVIDDWVGALCKVYDNEYVWERRSDVTESLLLRRTGEFRLRNDQLLKDIPEGWDAWCKCAYFELFPSPQNLAAALRSLGEAPKRTRDAIEWRSSWPLVACIRTARSDEDIFQIADMVSSGLLGSETSWRKAEASWRSLAFTEIAAGWKDGMPWDLDLLKIGPPLSVVSWWVIADDQDHEIAFDLLELCNQIFEATSAEGIRKWTARACLSILRGLDSERRVSKANVLEWLKFETSYCAFLFPRPKALSPGDWLELVQSLRLRDDIGYVGDAWALAEMLDDPSLAPIVLKAMASSIRYGRRDLEPQQLQDVSARLKRLPAELSRSIDARIIRLNLNELPAAEDNNFIEDLTHESQESEFRIYSFLSIVGEARIPAERTAYMLAKLYRLKENSRCASRIIQVMRRVFQRYKSRLDEASVWDALALSLPYPVQNASEVRNTLVSKDPIHLSSLDFKDIGGIRSLTLSLTQHSSNVGQWTVILGPNGVGKTTLLKGIAVALRDTANPTIWPKSSLSLDWLRRPRVGEEPVLEGVISVTTSTNVVYKTSIRSSTTSSFIKNGEDPQQRGFPVFAYGCRRGSALGGAARMVDLSDDDGPEVATLFDETADLIHAETWLLQVDGDASRNQVSEKIFNATCAALCKILNLETVSVRDKRVWVKEIGGIELPLSSLSDGYLTNAGWIVDLLARWLELARHEGQAIDEDFLSKMTGLVLIDEIDLHLHPRWQIDVIARTRTAFPKMSFIVTTHNPLTLVGARVDEIWILARMDGEVRASMGTSSPMLLTGGQIYSEYFGISSVFPSDVGVKLQRYNFISRFEARSDLEEVELKALKVELDSYGVLPDWDPVQRRSELHNDSN